MSTPTRQGKTMSSRLLNMKFMQRSAPSTPDSPKSLHDSSSKRRKTDKGSTDASPSLDWEGAQAAREAEELQRSKALEKHVENYAQSHWTLDSNANFAANAKAMRPIVKVGYGAIDGSLKSKKGRENDGSSEDEEHQEFTGRKSFGNFKSTAVNGGVDMDVDEGETSDSQPFGDPSSQGLDHDSAAKVKRKRGSDDEDPGRAKRNRSEGSSHTSTPSKGPQQAVSLRGLQSISVGGGFKRAAIQCHECGKTGHLRRECPERRAHRRTAA